MAAGHKSANPVTNQNLRYVYQGFTNDGEYFVAFFNPITTTALPNTAGDVPADEIGQIVNTDPSAYLTGQAEALNKLTVTDWQPAIDKLDAVVASLRVAGMQANGLPGASGKLVAQRNGTAETHSANADHYTVVFSEGGQLSAQIDCNRVAGSYTAKGGSIGSMQTQIGAVDNSAACGPDSHADLMMNVLVSAQNYKVKPGGETLELIQPAGTVLIFKH